MTQGVICGQGVICDPPQVLGSYVCPTVGAYWPLLYRNVQRFRGGLAFKAHRLVYHSTLGLRVIKKKKIAGSYVCPTVGAYWPLAT